MIVTNMVYSDKEKIPLGQPFKKKDGSLWLRVKREKKQEDIPLDSIVTKIVSNAIDFPEAESPVKWGTRSKKK